MFLFGWGWLGRFWVGGAGDAALGAAALFAVGPVAAFFGAVGADRLGVRFFPGVGMQRFVIGRAGQQLVEYIFDVGPAVLATHTRRGFRQNHPLMNT